MCWGFRAFRAISHNAQKARSFGTLVECLLFSKMAKEIYIDRRTFLKAICGTALGTAWLGSSSSRAADAVGHEEEEIRRAIQAHRPSLLKKLPAHLSGRIGATHVHGKYYLTSEPFLIEGAR